MIADIFEAVAASPLLTPYQQSLGGEFLDVNDERPRIVWIPTTDTFRPGRIEAGLTPGDKSQPRAVATRVAGVRCRCWSKSSGAGNVADTVAEVRACEEMLRLLVAAVHAACYGSFKVTGAAWTDQDGASLTQYGRAVDVMFIFEIPIYETLAEQGLAITPLENLTQTGTILDETETQSSTIVSIDVTTDQATIAPAATTLLDATATYSDGTLMDVSATATWSSLAPAVATVDQSGVVTGVAPGTSTIRATLAGVSGAQPVTVV